MRSRTISSGVSLSLVHRIGVLRAFGQHFQYCRGFSVELQRFARPGAVGGPAVTERLDPQPGAADEPHQLCTPAANEFQQESATAEPLPVLPAPVRLPLASTRRETQ